MHFFIKTLPRTLCAGAISRVSFLDMYGPIAWVTKKINGITSRRIGTLSGLYIEPARRPETGDFCFGPVTSNLQAQLGWLVGILR